jgi:UDP:flavonoid glycosyltransferase YjiC (YdhE family)
MLVSPRIVLATVGSLGDLHPFIALGLALRARGATVVVACAAEYQTKIEGAGLEFRPVRPSFADLERELRMSREQMTRAALDRDEFLLRDLVMPWLCDSYTDMLAHVRGADLVLTSSLAFGARLAAEKIAIPWIAVVLQPLMFLSAFDPPAIPKVQWLTPLLRRLGPRVTRVALRLAKRALEPQLKPVHTLRAQIGLAPLGLNPLFEGQFSAGGALGLYSPLLGGIRADYPRPTAIVGFAAFDSDNGAPPHLAAGIRDFLKAGAAPLVFTLGSLVVNSPGAFYRESIGAARILGMRAVLLVGERAAAEYAESQGADVLIAGYAPHSLLFPSAAAIVHHGGIGTLAQALNSGRPQLIVPFYADQADNAVRAARLGVARTLNPAGYSAVSAARELARLLRAPDHASCAADVRTRLAREDGAAEAAAVVLNRLESFNSRVQPSSFEGRRAVADR